MLVYFFNVHQINMFLSSHLQMTIKYFSNLLHILKLLGLPWWRSG